MCFCFYLYSILLFFICLRSFPLIIIVILAVAMYLYSRDTLQLLSLSLYPTLCGAGRDAFTIRNFFSRAIYVHNLISRRYSSIFHLLSKSRVRAEWAKRRRIQWKKEKNNNNTNR